jgi:bifunctional UDP-N-acetylglucosamine pyrophosphorylase/glucosamine-1-phosphate N-acetyltransferase
MSLTAVVLAAGQGTRMRSRTPKVLHALAGRALFEYPVRAALSAGATRVVVVTSGHPGIDELVRSRFAGADVTTVTQELPRGTGDAARIGLTRVESERVLVLCGDTPLVTERELLAIVDALDGARVPLAFGSAALDLPSGYGRVLRDASGRVLEIREQRDLRGAAEEGVREVNAGIYAANTQALAGALARLEPNNAQGELYLTDVVKILAESAEVRAVLGPEEALAGVNDRDQLRKAEAVLFERIRARLGRAGVSVHGDALIDDTVTVEGNATIEAGVRLRGETTIGEGTLVDVGAVITDSKVAARAVIKPYSVITQSNVGEGAQIGPFAHLRPDSEIEADAHIGNFVETKKTRVRRGAKANHLAYLGDGDVGERANLGAGTIFCNYDGFRKHRTVIGEGAFVGSDSQLVAPVTVGKGAYVASGTTVTRDVPDDGLAISRVPQSNKEGYGAKLRERLSASAAAEKAKSNKP